MDRESVLNLPEDQRQEKLYEGASAVEGSLLAELFDANGERVYLYDIYGYEHSVIYVSRQQISESELKDLLDRCYQDQAKSRKFDREWEDQPRIKALYDQDNFDEVARLRVAEGIDAKSEELEGPDLAERLFSEFGMLRVACEQKIFEDDFRLKNYA